MNMSVNTSQNVSSNSSHDPFGGGSCFGSPPGSSIFAGFTVTNVLLLLPLSVSVLCVGFRRRRDRRPGEPMNPIDVFTYHMVAMETIGVCGSVVCCGAAFARHGETIAAGCNVFAIVSCVKMFFHVLTCVERYVAVVHPISYLALSKTSGVAIRNVGIGCVWAACSGLIALRLLTGRNFNMILFFCNLVLSLIVSSFCSLAVLRVLTRPRPGEEGGGNKGKADASKQKAFVTVAAIMAVLLLRFGGNLVCMALASSSVLSGGSRCAVQVSGVWFCLPSSYVLPLLFLHRAEKLPCFQYKKK